MSSPIPTTPPTLTGIRHVWDDKLVPSPSTPTPLPSPLTAFAAFADTNLAFPSESPLASSAPSNTPPNFTFAFSTASPPTGPTSTLNGLRYTPHSSFNASANTPSPSPGRKLAEDQVLFSPQPPGRPAEIKIDISIVNLIENDKDTRDYNEKTEEMMEIAMARVREMIMKARLQAVEPRKGVLRTTLSDIPPPIIYEHLFPLLKLSDFKALLAASKALTKEFEIPLSDLTFARFACLDHGCFVHRFLMGTRAASEEGIHHKPGEDVEEHGKMRCEMCADVICQLHPGEESSKLTKSRDGKKFVAYPHYCHGCDTYLCNSCLQSSPHLEDQCHLCNECGYSGEWGFCEDCEEVICAECGPPVQNCDGCGVSSCADCAPIPCFDCGAPSCEHCDIYADMCEWCLESRCADCQSGEKKGVVLECECDECQSREILYRCEYRCVNLKGVENPCLFAKEREEKAPEPAKGIVLVALHNDTDDSQTIKIPLPLGLGVAGMEMMMEQVMEGLNGPGSVLSRTISYADSEDSDDDIPPLVGDPLGAFAAPASNYQDSSANTMRGEFLGWHPPAAPAAPVPPPAPTIPGDFILSDSFKIAFHPPLPISEVPTQVPAAAAAKKKETPTEKRPLLMGQDTHENMIPSRFTSLGNPIYPAWQVPVEDTDESSDLNYDDDDDDDYCEDGDVYSVD